ncbi:nitroreductase family protein [bacterium]|nr:nitroreductase family protein [bacterium]
MDAILARRSIRSYQKKPVSDADVRTLLDAAMAAPSANNLKPWHFVTVTDREKLNALADSAPYWKMLHEAPLAIIICGDPGESRKYWDQDCIAATENILIAAAMLGLGGVWLGCHPTDERKDAVRKIAGIPAVIEPVSVVSLGHPAEEKEPRTQYDEVRVHRERWE